VHGQIHASCVLSPQKTVPVHAEEKDEWAPELVWTWWQEKNPITSENQIHNQSRHF